MSGRASCAARRCAFATLQVKTQHSKLGVGRCVTDPHRDLNAAGVTITLDQVSACGLRLQLQAPLLTTGRLSATLLAARLLVLKLLARPGPSISARDLSDQKLNAVAAALERVASLRNDYRQRIAKPEPPAEKQRIVTEANNQLTKGL